MEGRQQDAGGSVPRMDGSGAQDDLGGAGPGGGESDGAPDAAMLAGGMSGGAMSDGGGGGGAASDAAADDCDCDDGIECTLDSCDAGQCGHLPRHFLCGDWEYCSPDVGCVEGPTCASDGDCERPDTCATAACEPGQRRCRYATLDGDGDGDPPIVCGGGDCDDADALVHSGRFEACNSIDDDCDGVVDPPQDSGCGVGRSCSAGSCRCDAPTRECGAECVDVDTNTTHCGMCNRVCLAEQACVGGECECPVGESVCGNECVDLDTDAAHCGDCETSCGALGLCVAGGCQCSGSTTDCLEGEGVNCRDLTSDAWSCGACGARCLHGSLCEDSSCEATVTWVRMFGAPGDSDVLNHAFPLARGGSGEIYAGLEMNAGNHREVPGGVTTLWTSAHGIAKFAANGDFVWHVASTAQVDAVAVSGDDVWAMGHHYAGVTVGDTGFPLVAGADAVTWLVRLDPTDGDILESRRLDYEFSSAGLARLVVDGDGEVWLLHTAQGGMSEGDTQWTPSDNEHSSFLLRLSDRTLQWLPGFLPRSQVDPLGNLVIVMGNPPYNKDFTFGGDTLNAGATAQWAVVRYTPSLEHLNSFLTPTARKLGTTSTAALLMGEYQSPFIQRYSYDGASATLDLGVGSDAPLTARTTHTVAGRVFVGGRTGSGNYEDRDLGAYRAVVAVYDEDDLGLESLAAFQTGTGTNTTVRSMVVDSTGTEVTVSVAFSGSVTLGDVTYDSGDSSVGVALVRLHMP
jgi:hypothetical protein